MGKRLGVHACGFRARWRWIASSITIAVVAATAVAQPAQSQTPGSDSAVANAKKEGSVVVYSAAPGAPPISEINNLFQQRYGIRVDVLEGRASEIVERIRIEQSAGRPVGDVHYNGSTPTERMSAEGAFQPYGDIPNAKNVVPPYVADGTRLSSNALSYGILVNNNLVKPGDEPKSWRDLLDPKWQNKILADDMRALGGGSILFFALTDKLGADFHREFAKQKPAFVRDIRNAERRVTRGEYPLLVPEVLPYYVAIKGLPVRFVEPEEGCPYVRFDLTLLKDAPHPNAARLLMNFYLSDEAQQIFARGGYTTVNGKPVPAEAAGLKAPCLKLLGTSSADRQDEMLRLAREIYQ
jgi:iron(III) transport system substrate-binding protein